MYACLQTGILYKRPTQPSDSLHHQHWSAITKLPPIIQSYQNVNIFYWEEVPVLFPVLCVATTRRMGNIRTYENSLKVCYSNKFNLL